MSSLLLSSTCCIISEDSAQKDELRLVHAAAEILCLWKPPERPGRPSDPSRLIRSNTVHLFMSGKLSGEARHKKIL